MLISITTIMSFEAGHALSFHKGDCKNIHGHSYVLHITVTGTPDAQGMILDFKVLKKIVRSAILDELDHALILKRNDINVSAMHNIVSKIFWMDAEPTAEMLVEMIGERIQNGLPEKISLLRLRLYETASSYADIDYSEASA